MRVRPSARSFIFSSASVLAFFVACSSAEVRPATSGGDTSGGNPVEGGAASDAKSDAPGDGGASTDGATDANSDADADAGRCQDGIKNGTETDVDCGGVDFCPACALGKACDQPNDCTAGADCVKKYCAKCGDGIKNGDETDVDCGGKSCGPCKVGKSCKIAADCRSATCNTNTCACPKDMAIVTTNAGGSYCIDQAEVTKGQYYKFVTGGVDVNSQTGSCLTANTTFIPRDAWPPASSPGTLAFSMGLPVHYVDWCDANAYCKWAGKELCGVIGGGALAQADANDAAKSAWYNACSAQGVRVYPYGDTFDSTKCNTDGVGTEGAGTTRASGFGYATNHDGKVYDVAVSDATGTITSAAHTSCLGGSVGVYQMSGNVAEWEDSCDGATAQASCRLRGGSYGSATSADQKCEAVRSLERMPAVAVPDPLEDVGFRCCQY